MIAESWGESQLPPDGFSLFENEVTFHDGTALTVEDVIFTFERTITEGAIDGNTSPRKGSD